MSTDRKAKRMKRVRGEIMDAAVMIISNKGFKGTTTKEIAKEADMAEGTLYNYFKNKDDILMSIAERYIATKRNWDVPTDVKSVDEFLIKLYTNSDNSSSKDNSKDREVLRALLPEFLTDKTLGELYFSRIVNPFLTIVASKIEVLQEKGMIANYNPQALARILYSSLIGFAVLDINNDPLVKNPSPEFKEDVSTAFIRIFSDGMKSKS